MKLCDKPFYLNSEQLHFVQTTLERMTTEQKVGQLFCVLGDLYEPDTLLDMIHESYIGGVLLRPCNIDSLMKRNKAFDEAAVIPILKAANLEEGGDGAIADGNRFACPMQIAATGNAAWASRLGEECAREAELAGISWTFSPDADIDMNFRNPITNTRTFGGDAETVRTMAAAYATAAQQAGIAACAKHFPGDGVDYRDQHLHPTINALSVEDWNNAYGSVYRALIDSGVLSVMVGHILQPAWTRKINPAISDEDMLPASLSKELMTGLLRDELGFGGLIAVDATIMGGYTQLLPRKDALPLSIASGADMLVFNANFAEDRQFLLDAVADGRLTQTRLDEAVTKVLALKAHLNLFRPHNGDNKPALPVDQWIRSCAEEAITLVKDKSDALPITPARYTKVRLIVLGSNASGGNLLSDLFEKEFALRGMPTEFFDPTAAHMTGVGDAEPGRLDLYVANYEARSDQTAVRLFWNGKFALDLPRFLADIPSVFVSMSNPYHLQDVPRIKTFINAYTPTPACVAAVVAKLCGEQPFTGTSPVDPYCGLADTRW